MDSNLRELRDVEGALLNLVDCSEIRDALSRFCEFADSADVSHMAELFTDDCVTDYGPSRGGKIVGRDAFARRARQALPRFSRTHHQLGQIRVTVTGNRGSSVAYATAAHLRMADGLRYDERLQYHDEWLRTEQGWRISSRRAIYVLLDGIDAGPDDLAWFERPEIPS
jgi:uncharacterized protein (TIGR02246 family)